MTRKLATPAIANRHVQLVGSAGLCEAAGSRYLHVPTSRAVFSLCGRTARRLAEGRFGHVCPACYRSAADLGWVVNPVTLEAADDRGRGRPADFFVVRVGRRLGLVTSRGGKLFDAAIIEDPDRLDHRPFTTARGWPRGMSRDGAVGFVLDVWGARTGRLLSLALKDPSILICDRREEGHDWIWDQGATCRACDRRVLVDIPGTVVGTVGGARDADD